VNWHPNFQHKPGKLAGWEVMASKQFYRTRLQASFNERPAAQADRQQEQAACCKRE
jgi:hypothetical protein